MLEAFPSHQPIFFFSAFLESEPLSSNIDESNIAQVTISIRVNVGTQCGEYLSTAVKASTTACFH